MCSEDRHILSPTTICTCITFLSATICADWRQYVQWGSVHIVADDNMYRTTICTVTPLPSPRRLVLSSFCWGKSILRIRCIVQQSEGPRAVAYWTIENYFNWLKKPRRLISNQLTIQASNFKMDLETNSNNLEYKHLFEVVYLNKMPWNWDDGNLFRRFYREEQTTASFQMDVSDLNTVLHLGLKKYYIQRASCFT